MHPDVKSAQEGMCPQCGMKLVRASQKSGHEKQSGNKHAGHKTGDFEKKFWISLILSVPVVFYSEIISLVVTWQPPTFPGSSLIPPVLASFIFWYGGAIFLKSAYRELRGRQPGMMTLISLAIVTAYTYSLSVIITGRGRDLFWELSTLITIMLLGHWLEMKAVSGAQSALKELSKLLPDQAERIIGDRTETVPLAEIRENDRLLVRPGGKIPSDGKIIEGSSDVNESLITGESRPVEKKASDEVIAGAINGEGALKIQVTHIGEHTFLAGVMRLVAEAQSSKSRLQMLSDRAAGFLTFIALTTGAVTLITWLVLADFPFAIERAVAVLVIACPHALGLAIPLVASISTTKAAKQGFLVKQRLALEAARNIDVVLFDKTGTLTAGEFGVDAILPEEGQTEQQVLQLAASLNSQSEHPLAKAMVKAAQEKDISLSKVEDFKSLTGRGVQGKINNRVVLIGGDRLLEEFQLTPSSALYQKVAELARQGKTVIFVIIDQHITGAIALADMIRPESPAAIKNLKQLGLKTAMITGDSDEVARWVAEELDIDEHFARVLPEKKSQRVKDLQQRGLKVAFVGDGVNDAPALTQADLGVAIGAGTNVAIESAGIILVKNDPRDIVRIIQLSRLTYGKMIQNLLWATGYNVVAIPLAAGVLAGQGVFLQPALGAVFMSLSTIIVAANALLLKRKKL